MLDELNCWPCSIHNRVNKFKTHCQIAVLKLSTYSQSRYSKHIFTYKMCFIYCPFLKRKQQDWIINYPKLIREMLTSYCSLQYLSRRCNSLGGSRFMTLLLFMCHPPIKQLSRTMVMCSEGRWVLPISQTKPEVKYSKFSGLESHPHSTSLTFKIDNECVNILRRF